MNTLVLCLVLLIIVAVTIILCRSENGFNPATTHPASINVNAKYLLGFDPAKISPASI